MLVYFPVNLSRLVCRLWEGQGVYPEVEHLKGVFMFSKFVNISKLSFFANKPWGECCDNTAGIYCSTHIV